MGKIRERPDIIIIGIALATLIGASVLGTDIKYGKFAKNYRANRQTIDSTYSARKDSLDNWHETQLDSLDRVYSVKRNLENSVK